MRAELIGHFLSRLVFTGPLRLMQTLKINVLV